MLNFTPVTADAMTVMRPYYENCTSAQSATAANASVP